MTKRRIVVLGGPPGSGKSTVRKLLSARLGYETFSTGDFVRSLAITRGMTLEELNEAIAQSKELEECIDAELMRIEREGDHMVVDSHLAFHFIPSGFSVFLQVSLDAAARRIFEDKHAEMRIRSGDTMATMEEACLKTKKRVDNHRDRYMRHYGIDPYVPEAYDLVLDSEQYSPDEIVELIVPAYNAWLLVP
jgi:cytidylate kinase